VNKHLTIRAMFASKLAGQLKALLRRNAAHSLCVRKFMKPYLILFSVLLFFTSCAVNERHMMLSYEDFNPAWVSEDLLSPPFWSWDTCGCGDPKEKDPISVVIYKKDLKAAIRKYPIDEEKELDYRYLSICQANGIIDRTVVSMVEFAEGSTAYYSTIESFLKMKNKIKEYFGEAACKS
jgi:hypothetical protein